jgi:prepilin-type N-terminal cleavage/methylation domain-containing protein
MKPGRSQAAFTLVELLTVIAIVGILVAMVAPVLSNFRRGDLTASATRQLIDDVARARQLAISHRTTVYMVFVPTNFWDDPGYRNNALLTLEDVASEGGVVIVGNDLTVKLKSVPTSNRQPAGL